MIDSAHQKIKRRLLSGKTITPGQAWYWWGCSRLAPVIHRLIHDSYLPVDKDLVGKQQYARYYLPVEFLRALKAAS